MNWLFDWRVSQCLEVLRKNPDPPKPLGTAANPSPSCQRGALACAYVMAAIEWYASDCKISPLSRTTTLSGSKLSSASTSFVFAPLATISLRSPNDAVGNAAAAGALGFAPARPVADSSAGGGAGVPAAALERAFAVEVDPCAEVLGFGAAALAGAATVSGAGGAGAGVDGAGTDATEAGGGTD